jgi:MoaA/NifB/PqqE/SkfB family radical SAM enzyme
MDFGPTGDICLCNHSHIPVAQMSEDVSVLDVWRGKVYRRYRKDMSNYILDEDNCLHCIRQIEAGPGNHVFATEQFDAWAHRDQAPLYPKRLIFRLKNTCNLACIMCDGHTSSRIRAERDRLPPTPSAYGERFFKDMEEMLPHAEHLEFYGGEPFLVKEHVRIFELLCKLDAKCTIYVNTNGVSLGARAKHYLETLNFRTIAVSMDAVHDELHAAVRIGLRNDVFYRNMEYFLDLRNRRGVYVMLNVTEHRKNWFELPEIFRFAEQKRLYLHINTCIHPHNVTLYTLPTDQLRYVLAFLDDQRRELLRDYGEFSNLHNYDFLLSLIRGELDSRKPGWQPVLSNLNPECDGLLASPIPGLAPFDTPEKLLPEIDRIAKSMESCAAECLLTAMMKRLPSHDRSDGWQSVSDHLKARISEILRSRDSQLISPISISS